MKRSAFLLLSLLPLLTGCAGLFGPRERLTVACDFDHAPFAFVDESTHFVGFEVDLMEALADEMGVAIQWQQLRFEDLLPAVKRGEADAVIATIGITSFRERDVAFSDAYYDTTVSVLVRSGSGEPKSLEDLVGRRVATGAGNVAETEVRHRAPRAITVLDNPTGAKAPDRLLSREVDAEAMDGFDADDYAAKSDGALRVIDPPLAPQQYGIVLPLGHADRVERVNAALRELRDDGEIEKLAAKWKLQLPPHHHAAPARP